MGIIEFILSVIGGIISLIVGIIGGVISLVLGLGGLILGLVIFGIVIACIGLPILLLIWIF
jgi:hypothetical protein